MRRILLTCPFTGVTFEALQTADNNIIARNPITGDEVRMNYNSSCNRYYICPDAFKQVETLTLSEAAEILDVSIQRLSTMATNGVIKTFEIDGKKKTTLETVLKYKETRKVGAPKKG